MIGAWRDKAQRSMGRPPVVVGAVLGEDGPQVPFPPKIRTRALSSVRTVRTNRSAKQFARRHCAGIFTVSFPAPARTACKALVNWPPQTSDLEETLWPRRCDPRAWVRSG
jgi:hypothetical protein